jgi:hypothetical protein
MIRLQESYYKPIQDDLINYFYQWYYKPILELMGEKQFKNITNANNALISAIQKGSVFYHNKEFKGKFNSKISRELSKFAEYDKRSKSWKAKTLIPSDVLGASVVANDKATELNKQINDLIPQLEQNVKNVIKQMSLNIEPTIDKIDKQLTLDVSGLTVLPEITEDMRESISRNYTENMQLNIVNEGGDFGNWNEDQVLRLRAMTEKNVLRGANKLELMQMLMSEFDISTAKARFLARQETSLFMVEMRNNRYTSAGIDFYEWMTANDSRVVGNPSGKYPDPTKGHGNHYMMHKKICKFSDSTVYAENIESAKKGLWKSKSNIQGGNKSPGEEYECRCTAKPIL